MHVLTAELEKTLGHSLKSLQLTSYHIISYHIADYTGVLLPRQIY